MAGRGFKGATHQISRLPVIYACSQTEVIRSIVDQEVGSDMVQVLAVLSLKRPAKQLGWCYTDQLGKSQCTVRH